eukprot:2705091-Amphidinium_carterae.1
MVYGVWSALLKVTKKHEEAVLAAMEAARIYSKLGDLSGEAQADIQSGTRVTSVATVHFLYSWPKLQSEQNGLHYMRQYLGCSFGQGTRVHRACLGFGPSGHSTRHVTVP